MMAGKKGAIKDNVLRVLLICQTDEFPPSQAGMTHTPPRALETENEI